MIEICDYQTAWPGDYARVSRRLASHLGTLALGIDHIGSTAVAGLAAKDIIDVQVTVAELGPPVVEAIERAGYRWRRDVYRDHLPPGFTEHEGDWSKYFFKDSPGERAVHIHVRQAGRPNQRYPLLFRDYLIAHPSAATAYAELKRRLAASLRDADAYPEVKDPAVDLIYLAAEAWASHTGWVAQ